MTSASRRAGLSLTVLGCLLALLLGAAPSASAAAIRWQDCGDGYECGTTKVPRDYADRSRGALDLALTRLPATDRSTRIGSVFINFGGPGAPGAQILRQIGREAFGALSDRFDLVSWDPRGTGASAGALDCQQQFSDTGARSFPTPLDPDLERMFVADIRGYIARCLARNPGNLPYLATTNTVRDLDLLRASVGDAKLSYLGYSYGTLIGAQYATLFPGRARALALDGAVNVEGLVTEPIRDDREFVGGFERALGRFLQACAAQQDVCGFGGADPWSALDELIERLDAQPIPAVSLGGRPVNGEDVIAAAGRAMYAKQLWPVLAQGLALAAAGDGSLIQLISDEANGVLDDGTIDPGGDWFTAIFSLDARWPRPGARTVERYLSAGRHAWRLFDHFWVGSGYADLRFGLWPVRARGAYYGPVENSVRAAAALVVGTTYDPATPYRNARTLVRDLGNARLLTMRGDGHTAAFAGNSACIDGAVEAYLEAGTLPPERTVCRQEVPFAAPPASRRSAQEVIRRPFPVARPRFGAR